MTTLLKNIKISDGHIYEIKYSEDDNGALVIYDERGIKCRNKDIKFAILSEALIQSLYEKEELQHLIIKMSKALDAADKIVIDVYDTMTNVEKYSTLSNEVDEMMEEIHNE